MQAQRETRSDDGLSSRPGSPPVAGVGRGWFDVTRADLIPKPKSVGELVGVVDVGESREDRGGGGR